MRGCLKVMDMLTADITSSANSASFGWNESAAAGSESTTVNFTVMIRRPTRALIKTDPKHGASDAEIPTVTLCVDRKGMLWRSKKPRVIMLWFAAVSTNALAKWL